MGAAAGVGTAGKALTGRSRGDAPAQAGRSIRSKSEQLVLHGRQWHATSSELKPGQLPDRGHRLLARGELVAERGGEKVGEFYATSFGLEAANRAGPDGAATLELHTFNLADGSIIGTGTARAALDADDVFAIVGGTGRYLGARGSYVARQQFQELGGDGTAEFTITLITEEVPDGQR